MHYIINWIKRLNGDYRRTTRIRGAFPKPDATIFLLRYVAMKLTIKSRKAQSRRDDIFVAMNATPKPSSVGAKPTYAVNALQKYVQIIIAVQGRQNQKIRKRDEICRSYGAQLHPAILLLQRFSSYGAINQPHLGAPFVPDKSPVPSGRNLCSKEYHTQAELRRSETNLCRQRPAKRCTDNHCRTGQTKSKNTEAR